MASTQNVLEGLPLSFIENQGQADPRVSYYVQGSDTSLFFTPHGLTFTLSQRQSTRWAVTLEFPGSRPVRPVAVGREPGIVSYFEGPRSSWHTGIPTYAGVIYRNLWPGIDLAYSGSSSHLKYRFLVHPGADPSRIRLAYRGATSIRPKDGGLGVGTPAGGFTDAAPRSFQLDAGRRVPVSSSYAPRGDTTYGFHVGHYDRSRALVIDPTIILYAGYVGGSGDDAASAIALHSGNAYVTGTTASANFPVTSGSLDESANGGDDAFVAEVNAAGTDLVYAAYLGGSGDDSGSGIAVDSFGNAYVSGATDSDENTFPVTGGPDTSFNGATDAFVAKVSSTGSSLAYAGYIGGSDVDEANAIAVDSSGTAYVTGDTATTESDTTPFPLSGGGDASYNGGATDAFVAKVSSTGSSLPYSGYLGGSDDDLGNGVAVDSSGNAYVTGSTPSSDFPTTIGSLDTSFNGATDAYVAKVGGTGSLTYAGYIGGARVDEGNGIAVDSLGNAYVAGNTTSGQATFPVTGGPDLSYNLNKDAFVAKVNSSGSDLTYAGYIGGADIDEGHAIAVDSSGNAYVTGFTNSKPATFPDKDGPDVTYNRGGDAFVAKVKASGSGLTYAGYFGGSSFDEGDGIAVTSGRAYVAGSTSSTQATFPEKAGPDLTYNGGTFDAFVAKVGPAPYQPDGRIKKSTTSTYIGNDVYNLTADKQTLLGKAKRGQTRIFDIQEQNDGINTDTIKVKGPGNKPGFSVRYLAGTGGSTNVTTKVVNGTYTLKNMAPGQIKTFRLVVKVRPGAHIKSVGTWRIVGTSTHDSTRKDAVVAKVQVISGVKRGP
jgi:hypothetical protein